VNRSRMLSGNLATQDYSAKGNLSLFILYRVFRI
jgi:hypothetical protein